MLAGKNIYDVSVGKLHWKKPFGVGGHRTLVDCSFPVDSTAGYSRLKTWAFLLKR